MYEKQYEGEMMPMATGEKQKKAPKRGLHKVMTVIAIILIIILVPLLIVNLTLIIKGNLDPDNPPAFGKYVPMVVLSGSMQDGRENCISIGDLIFVKRVDPDTLKKDDIIAFKEGDYVVTHRINQVTKDKNGKTVYVTKGDANNTVDLYTVSQSSVVGIYVGRIAKIGNFAIWLQTPLGMLIVVGIPLLCFIAYDIIRRKKISEHSSDDADQLRAELAKLKAEKAENETKNKETAAEKKKEK